MSTEMARPHGLPAGASPGGLGARFGAWLVDSIVPSLVATGTLSVLHYANPQPNAVIVLGVLAGLCLFAWNMFVWWSGAERAATPGMRVMELEVVSMNDGRPLGWGRFFARWFVFSLLGASGLGWVLLIIWMVLDRDGRGWHDRLVGAVVLDSRAARASVSSNFTPPQYARRPLTVSLPPHLGGNRPPGDGQSSSAVSSEDRHAWVARSQKRAGQGRSGLITVEIDERQIAAETARQRARDAGFKRPPSNAGTGVGQAASRGADPEARFRHPAAEPQPAGHPTVEPGPAQSRPVEPGPIESRPIEPRTVEPPPAAYARGDQPSAVQSFAGVDETRHRASLVRGRGALSPHRVVPERAPTPPELIGVVSDDPTGVAPSQEASTQGEDLTRVASDFRRQAPRGAARIQWQITLDDGRSFPVSPTVLIGRAPEAARGERHGSLVKIGGGSRTVSKTHLLVAADEAGVYVVDRGSRNGSAVQFPDGRVELCPAGQPVRVSEGHIVRFGDHRLKLRRCA